ncbi:MAG TPA: hypothetical protein VK908_01025 [Jiangellales bacterium]|nr:hypothetical protein [Jiangellales bacterium]
MRVLVVHESLFGSTHQIADAIARGIQESKPDARVECMRVGLATPDAVRRADLLVVGGPTHMRAMTSAATRRMGLSAERDDGRPHHLEPGAAGPGVRDWFHDLPPAELGTPAAAFDTRADVRLAGGAAHGIARKLRHHGYELVARPEGFFVGEAEGSLQDGELERARAWGARLVRRRPTGFAT